ncbi:MAG: hypothetical protein IIY70_02705, partial [Oscillospiraceae bacterium]|nr:hypothetical protein [Oscillospiraceae bacterium]
MADISASEMQERLKGKEYLQRKLYANGFLISNQSIVVDESYPFYGNWKKTPILDYHFYVHKDAMLTTFSQGDAVFFMIGHAVDPFGKLSDEISI